MYLKIHLLQKSGDTAFMLRKATEYLFLVNYWFFILRINKK